MGKRRLASGEMGHVTRRALLGGAAAAGATSLVRPKVGLAAALLGQPAVFSRSIGALAGESQVLRATREFGLAGIEWSAPAGAHIELRAQARGGRWSPWVTVSALGHDGDGRPASGTLYGEPVWTGPAIRVQLRTDRHVSGIRVNFVSVRTTAGGTEAAAFPRAQPVLEAGPGQPPILARQAWARGVAHPARLPQYGTVKVAFVHHTVNPNGYGAAEVPAMLRAIFDYHRYVRGYWDIAYNFLIDAYGRIWEGRSGGIDMAVVGAHAGAYNTESTGVAMLGDFMNAVPRPAAIRALERLLAWKLSLHGLPATGRATVVVDPADAFYTRFRPGAHISLPRVAGHRDGDLTDCPGNALYGRLPVIRARVSSLAGTPARLTVKAPAATVTAGSTVQIAGRLRLLSGTPLSSAPLVLQQLGPKGPPVSSIAQLTTGADGSWSAQLTPEFNTIVRAVHEPFPASVSDWALIPVAPQVTLGLQSLSPFVLTGTVEPGKAHVVVDIYRAGATGREPIRKKRTTAAGGAFSVQLRTPPPGDYVAIARTAADGSNVAGTSAPVTVRIT